MNKTETPHNYINKNEIIDYMDAIEYCDQKKISYDKIVKTKKLITNQ